MDVDQIRRLEPKLVNYIDLFHDCFDRKDTRAHLGVYVRGQLSDLPEKSVEPIALDADVPPRTLQEFLSQHRWDDDRLRDRLHQLVAAEHQGPHIIGTFDETSDPKKGDKTPGVQKQWCGRLGKTENCIVTVHLSFAREDFHCLLDGELYLPESWDADRDRCREAGIPDTVTYRPKWKIALELYDRAIGNGLRFDWLTFDEGYGSKPELLRQLTARRQWYVAEVPRSFTGWLDPPRVVTRPYHRNRRGRGRRIPRLASGSPTARRVDEWLNDPRLRDQPWQRFRVKDGEKGPMVWECKRVMLTVKGDDGLPGETLHLLVARNVLDPDELKFFVSNAPPETSVEVLLLVAFSRWRVERCFEDQKKRDRPGSVRRPSLPGFETPLDSVVGELLVPGASATGREGGKSGTDGLPIAHGNGGADSILGLVIAPSRRKAACESGEENRMVATPQRSGSQEPHKTDSKETACVGHQAFRTETLSVGFNLVL